MYTYIVSLESKPDHENDRYGECKITDRYNITKSPNRSTNDIPIVEIVPIIIVISVVVDALNRIALSKWPTT